ncbi:MAG: TonB-dependent receptor [Crocinitomicaceae bacterium]|nr:TonB-dependent receptor [Crocinitomicaceae bacterium]
MKKNSIFLFFFLFSFRLLSQEILILDKQTQEVISGARVYSKDHKVHVLSDSKGFFNLKPFVDFDSIYVDVVGYLKNAFLVSSFTNLTEVLDNKIELYPSNNSKFIKTITPISEVVVSVNRWRQEEVKVSNKISKLNMKEVELIGPQTSADLLETSGYVFIQKSQFGGGSPQLRGFGTNQVMINIDGVRMNNAIFRSGNIQNVISLDANSLESVEVLFGPGSTMYGSDAIGGVMAFKSKEPKFSKNEFSFFSRYSTSANESTTHFDFNFGKKKWAFLTTATYSKFGDLKCGKFGSSYFLRPSYQENINGDDTTIINSNKQIQKESGYSQFNGMQKILFKPNDNWLFDYGFIFSTTSNVPRYDRLILDINSDSQLDNAEWYYGPQQWIMNRLIVTNSAQNKLYSQMKLILSHQFYKESRHSRKSGEDMKKNRYENVDAYSLNIDFNKKFSSKFNLSYGFEGVFNSINSNANQKSIISGATNTITPRYPDGSTWQTFGLYTNLKYEVSNKCNLHFGARYTIYSIKSRLDSTFFVNQFTNSNGALNGNLGLVYNPKPLSQIYVNLSSGFRAPNIDDIGKVFDSEPGSVVVPNLNLKPEFAYNAEIGFVQSIKQCLKLDAAIYYTYLDDALARSNSTFNGQDSIFYDGILSQVQSIQNISSAYVYGFQVGVKINFGKSIHVKSLISYQKGYQYDIDSGLFFPKSHVAPLFGRTTFSYNKKRLSIQIYLVYNAEVNYDDLPLIERDSYSYAKDSNGNSYTPSWYTLNMKTTYSFNKNISVNIGVENITDQLYRTFGSGISASGRNFCFSMKVKI